MLTCILACDTLGGIAKNGAIPWRIPQDLGLFRAMTIDSVVIMGRNTYDSLPDRYRPLPNRVNIIVTNRPLTPNPSVTHCMDFEQLVAYIRDNRDLDLWFIGGATLLQAIEEQGLINGYLLTIVHGNFDCDTKIDLDSIRFEKSRLIWDTYDKEINGLKYHFELRGVHGTQTHLNKIKAYLEC